MWIESNFRFTASDMMRGIDQPTFAEVAPLIRDFWEDQSIKQTFEQRNLFQIVILLHIMQDKELYHGGKKLCVG